MKLLRFELVKIWTRGAFLAITALLMLTNIFLMWTQDTTTLNRPQPSAYKMVDAALKGLTTAQQLELISEQKTNIEGIAFIDTVYRCAASGDIQGAERLREENSSIFEEYEDEYLSNNYLLYCADIYTEYMLLSEIEYEIRQVDGYQGFLDEILYKASSFSQISIFQDSADGFSEKNIDITASAYSSMYNTSITYSTQKGLMKAINYPFSDIILILSMMGISFLLVREERDNKLVVLVRSTPKGRRSTAAAKIMALAISMIFIVSLLYVVALLYCHFLYGIGDLRRTIQSVPGLMRSTNKFTVGQYLFYFIIVKWLAAVIAGMLIMLCVLSARHFIGGCIKSFALLGINFIFHAFVPATSRFNVLKYANLVGILNTNELLGDYHNLYWFGTPVSLLTVEAMTGGVSAAILFAAFLIYFSSPGTTFVNRKIIFNWRTGRGKRTKRRPTSLFRHEQFKLMFTNAAFIVLCVFAGFQLYQVYAGESYLNARDLYYQNYMRRLEGAYTTEKYAWIKEEASRFEPIRQLERSLYNGEITEEEFSRALLPYGALNQEYIVFNDVMSRISYVERTPGAQIVYEKGYLKLLSGFTEDSNLIDSFLCIVVMLLSFPGLFAMEYSTGMIKVIHTTPQGRKKTVQKKLATTALYCLAVAVMLCTPRYWMVCRDYGLGRVLAPMNSIPEFSSVIFSKHTPLIFLVMAFFVSRLLSAFIVALIIHTIALKTRNTIITLMCGAAVTALPLTLAMINVRAVKWVSIWPLVSFPVLLTQPEYMIAAICLCFSWCFIGSMCVCYICESFVKKTQ